MVLYQSRMSEQITVCPPDDKRAISSVGQSHRLITGRSGVRVPDGPPFRGIAQLVEQRSPKPRAEGSSPSAPAKKCRHRFAVPVFFVCA